MRVTKLIREYVEKEVGKKFEPAITAAMTECSEYEKQYNDECNALRAEIMEKSKAIAAKYGAEVSDRPISLPISLWNHPIQVACSSARRELQNQRDQAIEQVLLNLELGATTKADLVAAIAAIQV